MRRAVLALAALALLVSYRPAATATVDARELHAPRYVILDDYVRARLAADWDKVSRDSLQVERAYCLRWELDVFAGEFAYRVTQIAPPDSIVAAGHANITYYCGHGRRAATLHVHPPTTCTSDTRCILGGTYAWQCFPSPQDELTLRESTDAFALIQCDRHAVVFHFPHPSP